MKKYHNFEPEHDNSTCNPADNTTPPLLPCLSAIYHQPSLFVPTNQSAACILYSPRPLLLPHPIYHKTACSTSSPFRLVMGVGVEVRRRVAVGEKVQRSRTGLCCTRHVMLLPRSGRLPAAGVPPVPHCPLKKKFISFRFLGAWDRFLVLFRLIIIFGVVSP